MVLGDGGVQTYKRMLSGDFIPCVKEYALFHEG